MLDHSVGAALAQARRRNPAVLSNPALGYCTRACAQGSSTTCTRSSTTSRTIPALAMSCQQLVLDQATIAEICRDPAKCQALLRQQPLTVLLLSAATAVPRADRDGASARPPAPPARRVFTPFFAVQPPGTSST